MDKILAINTIKNVFSALGAKTSDSNYAVALLDKTSAEPKGMMDFANLASVLGAIEFVDIYQKDFNIDTLVVNGVSYFGKNVRMCLTDQATSTWDGTFPTGLSKSGAEVLTLGKGSYGIQQFFAQDGYASRVKFGVWKSWMVFKP